MHTEDPSTENQPLTDREEGGPTADEEAEGTAEGEAHGTRPSEMPSDQEVESAEESGA